MDVNIIPIVGMSIPIIIVPTILAFKHARYLREVEHAERIRAMELGRRMPGEEPMTLAGIATSIGVGVPLGSLGIAWLSGGDGPISYSAGLVGLGGLICGTILAIRQFAARQEPATPFHDARKPEPQPDAYDFAGHRG